MCLGVILNESLTVFVLRLKLGYLPSTAPCVEYWEKLLTLSTSLFPTRRSVTRATRAIQAAVPCTSDEVAFCALADALGNVENAVERLRDPSYEREVSFICSVIDIERLLEQALPVRLPSLSIASPTKASESLGGITPGKVRLSPGKSPVHKQVLPSSLLFSSPRPLRLEQMLDHQFQRHVQSKLGLLPPEIVQEQSTEKFDVLNDFRMVNTTLLPSQSPFGSDRLSI